MEFYSQIFVKDFCCELQDHINVILLGGFYINLFICIRSYLVTTFFWPWLSGFRY